MNIVILAGGTGSIALQTGLFQLLDSRFDGVNTKVIVNAYDNGLSTGVVRRVFGGAILGPSDIRKNQSTRLKLENPKSPWNKFLDIRFTVETSAAREYCLSQVAAFNRALGGGEVLSPVTTPLKDAIDVFFECPIAKKIDYTDFALANIIYAGLARANNNSIRRAAGIMASLMEIPDNVILNDDKSLFLGAITKSGIRVTDEGDIVSWGKQDDPFVDIFFTDAAGNETMPVLCQEARDAIMDADLIIASSGTQWSSLIPTYASSGFTDAIANTAAKIVVVMNRHPDKDSPGQTASDIVDVLVPKYFPKGRIHLLLDTTGHPNMSNISKKSEELLASVSYYAMGVDGESHKHNPAKLAVSIGRVFFNQYLDSAHYMFDYDDTLVGRGNYQPKASALNKELICQLNSKGLVSICTGNSIKAVNILSRDDSINTRSKLLTIYADGGINEYMYDVGIRDDDFAELPRAKFIRCVNPVAAIDNTGAYSAQNIISMLQKNGIPLSKIENRGNVIISIKPIDDEYRPAIQSLVEILLKDTMFQVKMTGRTTIDIMKQLVSKASAVNDVLDHGAMSITYVGDELDQGNDLPIAKMDDYRVKCLRTKDPAMTAFFLSILLIIQFNG